MRRFIEEIAVTDQDIAMTIVKALEAKTDDHGHAYEVDMFEREISDFDNPKRPSVSGRIFLRVYAKEVVA